MILYRRQPIDLLDINGDDDGNSTEAKWMQDLTDAFVHDHCPPITLGSGGTTLSHKFFAVTYAMWLISGKTMRIFKRFLDDLSVGTSDFGVEFSLSKVMPKRAVELFPWMFPDDTFE
eukprot:7857362-Pyramimonas_sp.AAC.1